MKVYHGSYAIIRTPDLSFARANLDFGRGFYLTSYANQAEHWAKRKALRKGGVPIVNVYDLSEFSELLRDLIENEPELFDLPSQEVADHSN